MASTPISITGLLSNVSLSLLGSSTPLAAVSVGGPLLDPVTASISLTNDATPTSSLGTLSGPGLLAGSSPGRYTLSAASPALLTTALKALQFTPAAGATMAPMLTLTVTDPSTSSTASSVIGAVAPTVSDATTQLTSVAGGTLTPLSGLTITDPSAIAASANVTLTMNGSPSDADGTLSGVGVSSLGNGQYTVTAPTLVGLNADLNDLKFTPVAGSPGSTTTTELQVAIVSPAGTTTTPPVSLIVSTPAVPASITGLPAVESTAGTNTIKPFGAVSISDPSDNPLESATITLSVAGAASTSGGSLTAGSLPSSVLTSNGHGTYTLAATDPVTLTSELDQLVFVPSGNSAAPTTVSLDVTNAAVLSAEAATVVNTAALPASVTPVITGLPPIESGAGTASVDPFGSVSVSDTSTDASDSATITLLVNGAPSDANGRLTGAGLTESSQGYYTLAASGPATLSAELDALSFTRATAGAGTTIITLDVSNAAALQTTGSTTLTYQPAPPPENTATPVISGVPASESDTGTAAIHPYGAVIVSDATTNAADGATITLTVNGVQSDADGSLSGAGLTQTLPGLYNLAATDPATLSAELQALVFTPIAGTAAATTGLRLAITNQAALQATATTSFTDHPAPPASNPGTTTTATPVISGVPASESDTGTATIHPFGAVTVSDATTNAADGATITLTIAGNPSDADGTLSGAGLTETSTGVYTLTAASPATLSAELQALVFTPTAGTTTTTTGIALAVTNQAALQATASTSLTDTPASNPGTTTTATPVISGVPASESDTGTTTIHPFGAVTVSDATTNAADGATITLTIAGNPSDADGTLSGAGLTETSTGVYTLAAASPATLTAELQALVFTPIAGTAAATTGLTLAVTNQAALQATASTSLTDTPASNPGTTATPVISGVPTSESDTGTATIHPFGAVTISDATTNAADGATITLTIAGNLSDANGTLSGAGLTETSPGVYSLAAASPATLSAELQALVFTPTAGTTTTTTGIALAVTNQAALQATASTSLTDTPATPASNPGTTATPVISGVPASESDTGTTTIHPFGAVTVSDATTNAADGATITLTIAGNPSDADGTLSGAGLTETSTGVYTLTAASPATLSAELQALVFTPTAGTTTATTGIALAVTNQAALQATASTSLTDTPASNPGTTTTATPVISGVPASESDTGTTTIHPFGAVTVSDATTNAADGATITLTIAGNPSDADGTLSGAGLTETSTGVYTLTATSPATLTAELQALVFTPTAGTTTATTGIALAVTNQAAQQATATTSLTDTPATPASNPAPPPPR